MANVLIVYGSTTGNTEWVAGEVKKLAESAGHSVDLINAASAKADGLCQGRDLALFGCSTWGQDEIELQDDFVSLFEKFDKIGASGVKTAVFGCGDEDYEYFCGAVDAIGGKLKELGANVVCEGLKINGDPGDSAGSIEAWARKAIAAV